MKILHSHTQKTKRYAPYLIFNREISDECNPNSFFSAFRKEHENTW